MSLTPVQRAARVNAERAAQEEFMTQLREALDIPEIRQRVASAVAEEWHKQAKRNGGRRG